MVLPSPRAIAGPAFDRKEVALPLARCQFARDDAPSKVDELLRRREDANDARVFQTRDDDDPRSIGAERRLCQRRPDDLLAWAGKHRDLAPRLGRPEPD